MIVHSKLTVLGEPKDSEITSIQRTETFHRGYVVLSQTKDGWGKKKLSSALKVKSTHKVLKVPTKNRSVLFYLVKAPCISKLRFNVILAFMGLKPSLGST